MSAQPRKTWKERVRLLKRELYALVLACKDRRVPWYSRLFLLCLLAYAFSPLDLIPDMIPVLGLIDDLILLPLGILLAIKMIPPVVMQESRAHAEVMLARKEKPTSLAGAVAIVLIWLFCCALIVWLVVRIWR